MPTYKALGIKLFIGENPRLPFRLLRTMVAIAIIVDLLLTLRTLMFPIVVGAIFASVLIPLAWFYLALFIIMGRAENRKKECGE